MNQVSSESGWVLTAFEPFGRRTSNASADILEQVADARIERHVLPVVFDQLQARIAALLDTRPRALVLMGEASRRRMVAVERVALNILDGRGRPDNRGDDPTERPVVVDEPLARAATWNADRVVAALRASGVPASKSYHAGAYACNQSLYLALSLAAARGLDTAIGFLHVPSRAPAPAQQATLIAAALPDVFTTMTEIRP